MGKEKEEEICVQRFLNWYNKQYKGNYVHQRATAYFPELKNVLRWEFVVYECDNPKEWIGIEIKELSTFREVDKWFEFWKVLCSDLTKGLAVKGIQGKFKIMDPPVLNLRPRERPKLLKAFLKVLADKETILKADFTDVGPDIADKFANWSREKNGNRDEYRKWGEDRPRKLLINKSPDSGCEVSVCSSPIVVRDAVKQHEQTFNEVFKLKGDAIQANKQLKLAKEKGANKTILLLACKPSIYEDLIKNQAQDLDRHLISDIDFIYLVDMGSKGIVVKIYPN